MRISVLTLLCLIVSAYSSKDLICPDQDEPGSCYPRIFEATTEWQIIKPGQELVPGLHVRMSLETGEKEAKLIDPEEKDDDKGLAIQLNEGDKGSIEIKEPEPIFEATKDDQQVAFHKPAKGSETINHKPKNENLLSKEQHDEFTDAVRHVINFNEITSQQLEEYLISVEDSCHEIDFGVRLIEIPGALDALVDISGDKYTGKISQRERATIRGLAAQTVGAALRNNEPALYQVAEWRDLDTGKNLIQTLIKQVSTESDQTVKSRLIYALASAISMPSGRHEFLVNDGSNILLKLFLDDKSTDAFRVKCATFIEDGFVNRDMLPDSTSTSSKEQVFSKSQANEWSNALQNILASDTLKSASAKKSILLVLSSLRTQYKVSVLDKFLKWMAEICSEAPECKHQLEKRQTPNSQPDDEMDFLRLVVDSRHSLFGNPKASRKSASFDEL